MKDKRLQDAVTCLDAAMIAAGEYATSLMRDGSKLLHELESEDDCGGINARIEVARAAKFVTAAERNVGQAVAMLVQARDAVKAAQQ